MKLRSWLAAAMMAAILITFAATPVRAFTAPVATSFSFTASTVGASLIQLQGSDADGTALTFAIGTGPSHGALSGLNTSTGYVVYTPTSGYTGADSFTFTVTSGGDTTSPATVSLTVTSAKTRIVDTLVDPAGNPREGKVTFILTTKVTSPAGIIPIGGSVSAVLSSGQFDVSVYPSASLSPTAYYQVWFEARTGGREPIGVYNIPASTASSILLSPYAVTNAALAAQYTFLSAAAINSLVTGIGSPVVSFNSRTGAVTPATNDYTWAQINKATSSIADITTRSASDLSIGTLPDGRFPSTLPAVNGSNLTALNASNLGSGTVPDARFPATLPALNGSNLTALNASNLASGTVPVARLGTITSGTLPYSNGSALANSPLSRISANGVQIAAGGEAPPSTSNYLTATKLLLFGATDGEHIGLGVESGAGWLNLGSTNSFKFYWGASSAEKTTVTPGGMTFNTLGTSYTLDYQTSGDPEISAMVLNTNASAIRMQMGGSSDNRWDFTQSGFFPGFVPSKFRPFNDNTQFIGDEDHRVRLAHITELVMTGSSSGVTGLVASEDAGTFTTFRLPFVSGSGTFDTLVSQTSAETLTNKTLDTEASGNSVTVPIKVFLAAAGCNNTTAGSFWDLPTSAAAAPACVTGTNIQKGVLDFADAGAASAQNTLILPADFSGAIDARIIWTTSATSGNAKWSLSTICTDTAATATDDPSFNTASTVTTAAPGTANRVQTSSITSVTASGCSAGRLIHLKILRDGTDGSDTIGATARLIGVEITIRRVL